MNRIRDEPNKALNRIRKYTVTVLYRRFAAGLYAALSNRGVKPPPLGVGI